MYGYQTNRVPPWRTNEGVSGPEAGRNRRPVEYGNFSRPDSSSRIIPSKHVLDTGNHFRQNSEEFFNNGQTLNAHGQTSSYNHQRGNQNLQPNINHHGRSVMPSGNRQQDSFNTRPPSSAPTNLQVEDQNAFSNQSTNRMENHNLSNTRHQFILPHQNHVHRPSDFSAHSFHPPRYFFPNPSFDEQGNPARATFNMQFPVNQNRAALMPHPQVCYDMNMMPGNAPFPRNSTFSPNFSPPNVPWLSSTRVPSPIFKHGATDFNLNRQRGANNTSENDDERLIKEWLQKRKIEKKNVDNKQEKKVKVLKLKQ